MPGRESAGKGRGTPLVGIEEVVAFRVDAHNLRERLPEQRLHEMAGACGVQNSPPGSALVALHARVCDMSQGMMDAAIEGERSLLQTWSMRGAPFFFPTVDSAVFTTGVLPEGEAARRRFIRGVEGALDELAMSLGEAVELIEAEVQDVLSGRQLALNELGVELGERIAPKLSPTRRKLWQGAGTSPLSKRVVHFCLRILALKQIICFAPRKDNKAPFVLVEEWLGERLPNVDRDAARAELTRRYLRCYGPSTRKDFASWLGIAAAHAQPWWLLVEEELREVDFAGSKAWILADDLDILRSPPSPRGLRLLPPHDPFIQQRDRRTLVPDRKLHPKIWKLVGAPGTALHDGRPVATWRSRRSAETLSITVQPLDSLTPRQRERIKDEAESIAGLRGCPTTDVEFAS